MIDTTPTGVLHRGINFLLAKDMGGFIDLFHHDAVMEFPFAPPGQPARIEGVDALHDYLDHYPELLDVHEITGLTVHQTTVPDIIIVEFTARGLVVATGRPYEMSYISVLTVRDARIAHYRDYWNPLTSQELFGDGLVETA